MRRRHLLTLLLTGPALAQPAPDRAAEARYLEVLGLLESHLLVGQRLMAANLVRLARPQFNHALRELYGWLEPRLAAHAAAGFEAELTALEDWTEAGNASTDGAFAAAWTALQPKLQAARNAVPAALRNSPRFMLDHVAAILWQTQGDYGESIERGRIVNIVEFQEGLGHHFYLQALVAAELAKPGAIPAWAAVNALLAELHEKLYPELLPPARPPMSVAQLRGYHARVQAIAAEVTA